MNKKILMKLISVILAIATLVSASQITLVTAFADETSDTKAETNIDLETTVEPEMELTVNEVIEMEMAARSPVTKDRSEGERTGGLYAVYVDGMLYAQGEEFKVVWDLAMDKAAYVVEDKEHSNEDRSENVELVLYTDVIYTNKLFSEGTMTVSNRKLTIDLNGHILGRSDKGGSVIHVTNNSKLTIMDSDPNKEHGGTVNENDLWVFSIGGDTKLYGGIITGGYYKTGDGGGLYIDKKSTVYMTGGTIAGNKADVGSAVYLEDHSVIDMSVGNSQICYNYCAGTTTDGGAIFLRSNCAVTGGYVHHNRADDYGGGIRAKGDNIYIKDVVVYANKALEYGGGFYIERSSTGQTVNVTGCKIVGNYTGEDGGGVYIYDLMMVNMVNCIVEENIAGDEGGGICLSDWTGTDLTIGGKMIVRNNTASIDGKSVKSNLYLEGDDDLIVGTMSLGSVVGIRTETSAKEYNGIGKKILVQSTASSHLYFFCDEDGYTIKYQNDPAKDNYRYLYIATGTRTQNDIKLLSDYITKQLATPYTVESGEYEGKTMPILKGYFEYDLMSTGEFDSLSPFYYSDGYFLEDPAIYNKHLATMSINAAVAAFGRMTTHVEGNDYANHFANIKQLFSDIGCYDVNFFANEDYQMKPAYFGEDGRLTTIGVAISQKEIKAGGETYTLVPVAIRGGGYETEWASNVTIGSEGEAEGFSDAANQVYAHIQAYIQNYGLSEKVAEGKVKFWVVGYSRAGATANLTSKRLIDNYAQIGNQVYGYTFEAPMGGVESAKLRKEHTGNGAYPTIHNTVNQLDFVTLVAPTEMDFIRYGVDHYVGSTDGNASLNYDTNSDYYKQKTKMLAQLSAINPYYNFDDKWTAVHFSILEGILNMGFVNDGAVDISYANMYVFLRSFFEDIQKYGLDMYYSNMWIRSFREAYSNVKPLADIDNNKKSEGILYSDPSYNFGYSDLSVEKAAANLVWLVMGSLTDEQFNELIEVIFNKIPSLKEEYLDFETWLLYTGVGIIPFLIITIFIDFMEIYDIADRMLISWEKNAPKEKAANINWLIHKLLDSENGSKTVWDVLDNEQEKAFAEALPVILWFALNFVAYDLRTNFIDASMWEIPIFVYNMSAIVSNHYQEVSVAWVRSYDSYYDNETQAYVLDTSKVVYDEPVGFYMDSAKKLTISGQDGSSIFYSVDGGNTWKLYSKEVTLEQTPEKILCFSIYRGVKSEVKEISTEPLTGSLLGDGSIWFLIAGSAVIVGMGVVGIGISRKKKKEEAENN